MKRKICILGFVIFLVIIADIFKFVNKYDEFLLKKQLESTKSNSGISMYIWDDTINDYTKYDYSKGWPGSYILNTAATKCYKYSSNGKEELSNEILNYNSTGLTIKFVGGSVYCNIYLSQGQNIDYSGESVGYIVERTGYYKIELWGAAGGMDLGTVTGYGAYVSGMIYLEKNETNDLTLYFYVGKKGTNVTSEGTYAVAQNFNGGGISYGAAGGGGSTDVRLVTNSSFYDFDSLKSRIMVAGGGGGSESVNYAGTAGGGLYTIKGNSYSTSTSYAGTGKSCYGSSQISGYGFGYGQYTKGSYNIWGGGGNGYFSGYSCENLPGGGGGGSSYISGFAGCVAISESSTSDNITFVNDSNGIACNSSSSNGYNNNGYNSDEACSYHYSNYKFTNMVMIDGDGYEWTSSGKSDDYVGQIQPDGTVTKGRTGNGYARITYLGETLDDDSSTN